MIPAVAAAFVVDCETRIFAIGGDGADQVLDAVAVYLEAAIGEEGLQRVPLDEDVGQLCAET